ncbi:MAG: hypothetical protein ACT4QB_00690 [Gammaproteobacteria bacterium]
MPANPRHHDRNTAAALLYAGAEVAFFVFIFLPAIVDFFNAAFVRGRPGPGQGFGGRPLR